ncbi:hypothetical protein BC834DRAFT_903310 [Gloeopeniophorella convolvens]|nr:hypothetical protein BC834DRAFT_903310 [Gloeopeniophorella convolvens]
MSAAVATSTTPIDGPSRGRKRSLSRSSENGPPPTRRRSLSPQPPRGAIDVPRVEDADPVRRAERERQLTARMAAVELEKTEGKKDVSKGREFDAAAEFAKLTSSRSGGVYMPPARLRALQEAAGKDRTSAEYQRLSWDALRKSITGMSTGIMKAQAASLPFTPVLRPLWGSSTQNCRWLGSFCFTGDQPFRRAFKRNDKTVCHSTTTFLAHLVNQGVAHELIALQILVLLLERPTDDSIEIAVANATVFERFRAVLNEGNISHRVQYMIEVLMQLEEDLKVEEGLNIFKFDANYLDNEEKYKAIKAGILGEGSSDDESGSEESESDEEDEEAVAEKEGIEDLIYLTIMNALNYEEAVHKLLKVQLKEGEEVENIVRSYSTFYGLVSERFASSTVYGMMLRTAFETLFGHLFANDAISWASLQVIKINEDDTTSSSRIFVKIMMQEVIESMGLATLKERFADPEVRALCHGMFPLDNPKNTRFAINYFTSIGLGALTEEMREHLKNAPRLIMEQRHSDSDSTSDVSRDRPRARRSPSPRRRSPSPRRRSPSPRRRSLSPPRRAVSPRRRSPPPRRRSPSPPRPARRGRDDSRSPSPPPRGRRDDVRSGYSRDRREPEPARSRSPPPRARKERTQSPPPPREAARGRDRDYDHDRREMIRGTGTGRRR